MMDVTLATYTLGRYLGSCDGEVLFQNEVAVAVVTKKEATTLVSQGEKARAVRKEQTGR